MFYTIYKITNQIDGKFYVGSHKTKDLNDNYMGSGKYLKHAQEKYGIENFVKEILFVFENADDMYAKEAEIVNEDFLATENTYNLKIGGFGGWDYLNDKNKFDNPTHSPDYLSKISKLVPLDIKRGAVIKGLETINQMYKSNDGVRPWSSNGFTGKTHSSETRLKMSLKSKERLTDPTKNSQFGTMWITNGKENAKIPKVGIIPTGWRKGRVSKKSDEQIVEEIVKLTSEIYDLDYAK
jgi:group I intron endonuclease